MIFLTQIFGVDADWHDDAMKAAEKHGKDTWQHVEDAHKDFDDKAKDMYNKAKGMW